MSSLIKLVLGTATAFATSVITVIMMLVADASPAPKVQSEPPVQAYLSQRVQSLCPSGHGVYVGAGAPAAVTTFEQWSGSPVGCVQDFLSSASWADISVPTWWLDAWAAAPKKRPLVLSVPMLPDSGADLLSGAQGDYDRYFRTLATSMVAKGFAGAIIRLGWEFNAGDFAWTVLPAGGADGKATSANFVAYWKRVVLAMRSVPGSNFTFDWTVNNGVNAVDAEQSYPGDEFVDIVGIDAYDQVWGPYGATVSDPVARWRAISEGTQNLDYWAAFARSRGKAVSVPEWGLVSGDHGGGDNPYYVQKMLAWVATNKVAFETYMDSDPWRISSGRFPAAATAYVAGMDQR